jgi:RyR domain/ATPase family associated with various cellular activities (AAA)
MTDERNNNEMKSVIVTGDVTVDNYIYEGERDSSHKWNARGLKIVTELGGAGYTYKILHQLMLKAAVDEAENRKKKEPVERFDITENWEIKTGFTPETHKNRWQFSHSIWKPFPYKKDEFCVRMFNELGYGDQQNVNVTKKLIRAIGDSKNKVSIPNILILDDAGFQFRSKLNEMSWLLDNNVDWIILKMSRPLAIGDLWDELIKNYSDKLIVIISADEIRAGDIKIAKGFSWEQTIEDTRNTLFTSYPILNLKKCKHLILSYNNDGALWLNSSNRNNPIATLLCDTSCAENDWSEKVSGKAFGYMSCLTAAVVYKMIEKSTDVKTPDIATGIEAGLSAMRNLLEYGHGWYEKKNIPAEIASGFPAERIAGEIRYPQHTLSPINIPWLPPAEIKDAGQWMIAEMLQRSPSVKDEISLHGLATQVVYYGTNILNTVPHAKFNSFITTDRHEIETLRRLKHFMIDYRENKKANKPVSFGVFGPPGAGKSFGVKQIAFEVFDESSWLEFNLSQFTAGSLSELYGAFHQVRDKVLAGTIPVVFMDEFDSKKYEWLQYLLSPMQEGEFQEGQLKHKIGKCIFVFAGATSYTYESFGVFKNDSEGNDAKKDFLLKKGPDFKSRLDAYFNVLGPNQRILDQEINAPDPADISCPLRRAIFISTKIKYEAYLPAQIDPGLVNALLRVPKYIHGARSLDKLLSILQSPDKKSLNRSNVPADAQLSVYVDPDEFNKLLSDSQNTLIYLPIEELAPAIHESFRKFNNEKKWPISERFDKPYESLDYEAKEDNIAAGKRIQEILAAVNLRIEKADLSMIIIDRTILDHINHHIELLSTLEHNGWMMQRFKFGWKYDKKRNDEKKLHNLLIPYSKLPNNEKEKDRNSIADYPERLKLVGYRINWINK